VNRRAAVVLLAKLALGGAVLYWVFHSVDLSELAVSMRRASPALLAGALVLFVADDLVTTHKWRRLLEGVGIRPSFRRLFQVYLKGRFLGFFVPSSVTSDLYKGAALSREHGSGKAVVSSIVLERLLGLVSLATIGVVAAGALPARVMGVSSAATVAIGAAATLAGLAVFLQADRIARAALPLVPSGWLRVRSFGQELAGAFAVYRARVPLLVEAFLLSLVIQATRSAAVFALARAVDDRTPFLYFLLLVPYVYLVNLLPVASSRLGLEQGVFVVLFGAVGMSPETALAISLLSVAGSLVACLPGGFWLAVER
jgi:glycosyltransferase 2 family protein